MPDLGLDRQLVDNISAQLIRVAPELRAGRELLEVDDEAFASPVADALRRSGTELFRLSDATATLTQTLGTSAAAVADQVTAADRSLASAAAPRSRVF
ncbi:MAG TPA: hypothetical protein VN759_12690 [Pseudolysinimonas sp.]|nr:hypothetical protein [Pseudolysinimonas sp.]